MESAKNNIKTIFNTPITHSECEYDSWLRVKQEILKLSEQVNTQMQQLTDKVVRQE
jgi:hypothetical protein